MSDELVVVKEFDSEVWAHFAQVNLEATGFECMLIRARSAPGRGTVLQLVVRREEAEEAAEILREIAPPDGE